MHIHSILQVINNSWVSLLLRRSLGRLHVLHLHLSSAHCGQCQWPMRKPLTAHGSRVRGSRMHDNTTVRKIYITDTVQRRSEFVALAETCSDGLLDFRPFDFPLFGATLARGVRVSFCGNPCFRRRSPARSLHASTSSVGTRIPFPCVRGRFFFFRVARSQQWWRPKQTTTGTATRSVSAVAALVPPAP